MNANNTDVLVIDDSATIRKLVEMSMRGTQFRVHFANSGADGLEQARALRPGVILLDCVLPDSSGLDVCRQLADDDRTRSIPVLLITARHERARDEFRQFGSVVDFVGKPFTGSDLLARVGRAVGTYLHGPLLPRNPWFADWVLAQALAHQLGEPPALEPLGDELEQQAHAVSALRARSRGGKR